MLAPQVFRWNKRNLHLELDFLLREADAQAKTAALTSERGQHMSEGGPNPYDLHVGQRVRERRKDMGMNQTQLGTHIGVTFQQLQKYERGTNRISASTLFNIATALQVPLDYFFEGLDPFDTSEVSSSERHANTFLTSAEGRELARLFTQLSQEKRRFVVATAKGLANMFDNAKV
jgi:transcriptional regulator with XRE-family HTH domain